VNFTQIISVRSDDPDAIVQMLAEWDRAQAQADVMGYIGTHVLADRDDPGHYLIIAEFAAVESDVSAAEEAARNNERPETQAAAKRLREVIQGEPVYTHFDELYRTG
jgi:heme-degrading monooxygenase HmoA